MPGLIARGVRDPRIQAALFLPIFIAAYWVPLQSMVHTWISNPDYSYGFIIPLISAYLFWEKRSCLRHVRIASSWRILPVLALAVALSLYGILGSSGNIAMPAIPLLLLLFPAFMFGSEAVGELLLPLGFLFFMVPVPAVIERSLGMFLKSVSTQLGGAVIRLCNISVFISGNIIDLGATRLQVVDACSGMRFLFPLVALGVLYAYFFERVRWKRIFCVIATLPIALLCNGLRIGITGILTNYYGKEAAEGFFHDFEGWVLFVVAFFCLYLTGRALRLISPAVLPAESANDKSAGEKAVLKDSRRNGPGAFYLSVLLLVVVGALTLSTGALPAMKIRGGIAGFPLAFGGWQGRSAFVDPEIVAASGAEESFSGQYVNGTSEPVSLYVGYRSTAFLENENFFHSPTVCLPSAGWKPVRITTRRIGNVPVFGELPVTEMLMESVGVRQLVYFWFQTKSRVTQDKNINRFHLTLHAIERDNTYDLFMRPITRIAADETNAVAEARLDNYVRTMMGAMTAFLAERVQ
jgi:exosortase D (VPLPA-CTERM-specific)